MEIESDFTQSTAVTVLFLEQINFCLAVISLTGTAAG